MLKVYDLKTEYRRDPVGIDAPIPRLSWKLDSDKYNVTQSSYEITARSEGETLWQSGPVFSDESQRVPYGGPKLQSGQEVRWQVTVTAGGETAVSGEASFEMGLLSPSDWKAKWIEPEDEVDPDELKPSPYLRKVFVVKPGLKRARVYQTAHGLYEFWINGKAGTDDKFKPGFTSYYQRIQYQTCDILPLLQEGVNAWSVMLGDGWWRGNIGGSSCNNFGYKLGFFGQIVLEYEDGTKEAVPTDESFKWSAGGLLFSDMKFGDLFDARREPHGWREADFDDAGWPFVHLAPENRETGAALIASGIPVREKETFDAKILTDGNNDTVLDFGQNLAGYVKMRLRGCAVGQTVTLVHGEGLENGCFSIKNVNGALPSPKNFQQVDYVAAGREIEEYCPIFSIFGFRYVLLTGYPKESIRPGDFTAMAVYSDLEPAGTFTCSNPLINKLVQNCLWSQKGNFMEVPTDCPTRERSPWTGDSQVYVKTASLFMNVYPFFEKWLLDLKLEQFENGNIGNTFPATNALHNPVEAKRLLDLHRYTFIAPSVAGPEGTGDLTDGSVGWGDTATITPYAMYLCYGDRRILENQYETARRWVDYQAASARDRNVLYEQEPWYHTYTDGGLDADYIFDTKFHWGEWQEPDSAESGGPSAFSPPEMAKRGNPLVATAYFAHSAALTAKMAMLLGKKEDAERYKALAEKVKNIYAKYFIGEDGTILPGRQAPYARALEFGLYKPEQKALLARKLAEAVENAGYKLNTGFLSTPFLLGQLTENGYAEHAYKVLEQTENPSWLHPVTLGATTVLESWNAMDVFDNSFNHYSYGAVCDFLFSVTAGIRPAIEAPGYKRFLLAPVPGGTLRSAGAVYESQYGPIASSWEKKDGGMAYHFRVPAGTAAQVRLQERFADYKLVKARFPDAAISGGAITFTLGSGCYNIDC